jgi:hypothetical protein
MLVIDGLHDQTVLPEWVKGGGSQLSPPGGDRTFRNTRCQIFRPQSQRQPHGVEVDPGPIRWYRAGVELCGRPVKKLRVKTRLRGTGCLNDSDQIRPCHRARASRCATSPARTTGGADRRPCSCCGWWCRGASPCSGGVLTGCESSYCAGSVHESERAHSYATTSKSTGSGDRKSGTTPGSVNRSGSSTSSRWSLDRIPASLKTFCRAPAATTDSAGVRDGLIRDATNYERQEAAFQELLRS